jgi:hypothetical protein
MDFLRLLEIDRKLVGPEAERSLLLADRVWQEGGSPREPWAIVAVLEKILQRCLASDIWYAPVLLQRKKALERGTWRPSKLESSAFSAASHSTNAAHRIPQVTGGNCPECGGTGIVIRTGGLSGSLCACGAYLQGRKRD